MYYSQFGEDRLLAKIFAAGSHGACIEVGANDGLYGSTSLHFEEQGWDCVLVEPNPALCRELRSRRRAQVFECAASSARGTAVLHVAIGTGNAHAVSALGGGEKPGEILEAYGFASRPVEVQTRTLDDILGEAGLSAGIDFVSIDVEGHELELLKGFSLEAWRPTILIIEDNAKDWRSAVSEHLRSRGYVRFRRTGVNDWYAHISNARLAGPARRLAYYPSMIGARAVTGLLKIVAPAVPSLERLPGMLALRDLVLGRKAIW